ncbi:aldo/keto reductase [Thalassotalea agarivorans]|uniref:Predicted oxidoreductase n=1 Tax=Thalassotalea agarivorans TaxID=349064 RepID=A0A1I0AWU8_THASX|nr:aldo/keto reductase [Thalassotalea agarivorans]SES98900.1 Predicted oxidoreductase [Thalassotalea agarivorans]
MQKITLGQSTLQSSRFVYGCMRLVGENTSSDREKGKRAIAAALDAGYNHFDHADIYGGGECESLFGEVLKSQPSMRDNIILTSKAGIRRDNDTFAGAPKRYDFDKDYIVSSVEASLKRLNTEQLDLFLLHRPDFLMDADEVAEAFSSLRDAGKVKHFGVSNFSVSQFKLLESRLDSPLITNQIEINIHNIDSFNNGMLDMCQQNKITPMAWCPLAAVAYSPWGNTFTPEDEMRVETEYALQAEKYQCEAWHIAMAWLLKHPANICPIVGSTNEQRIASAARALELEYSKEDWYRLLEARNGVAVP